MRLCCCITVAFELGRCACGTSVTDICKAQTQNASVRLSNANMILERVGAVHKQPTFHLASFAKRSPDTIGFCLTQASVPERFADSLIFAPILAYNLLVFALVTWAQSSTEKGFTEIILINPFAIKCIKAKDSIQKVGKNRQSHLMSEFLTAGSCDAQLLILHRMVYEQSEILAEPS